MTVWDDLPPQLLGPLSDELARLYEVARQFGYADGVRDTEAAHIAEAVTIYRLGHDAGMREVNRNEYHRGWAAAIGDAFGLDGEPETPSAEGVDPETVEACRRVSERLSDSGTVAARPHRHTMPWLWQPKTKATRRAGR